ncbi:MULTISPECIES: PIN domain-containing protein [unclassified Meridianimarinicoccus]|uniref:PIN domain-containing protein n=1 Tax=unclassified Meridianimarinicoccus TaxID=2923344 RepID=UPI0018679F42|nr:PIN domain-containing protein [Fluviibacterium sp. MJW13]
MIGLDTNVLVRFLTRDDSAQWAAAEELMSSLSAAHQGFVCREVVVELVWVLERAYGLQREVIAQALIGLLEAPELCIEAADRVGLAVSRYARGGAGFSDQMIRLAAEAEGGTLVTFDRKLAREDRVDLLGSDIAPPRP